MSVEMEKSPTGIRDTQAIESHRSNGDGERCYHVPHITHKLLGPTHRMEMEKGVVESHRSDEEGSTR